jgi:hypothetical protein
MKRSSGIEPTLFQLNQLIVQSLVELESQLSRSEESPDLIMANYFITILESNRALEQCIETHNYKPLVQNVNIEAFLNSTEKDSKTFKGEDVRSHLRRLIN